MYLFDLLIIYLKKSPTKNVAKEAHLLLNDVTIRDLHLGDLSGDQTQHLCIVLQMLMDVLANDRDVI